MINMTHEELYELVRGELERREKRTASVHAKSVLELALEMGLIEVKDRPHD